MDANISRHRFYHSFVPCYRYGFFVMVVVFLTGCNEQLDNPRIDMTASEINPARTMAKHEPYQQDDSHISGTGKIMQKTNKEKIIMGNWVEFDRLKYSTGNDYRQQRDLILRSTPDIKARIQSVLTDPDWFNRIMAMILEGWIDHRQMYTNVLAELDAVNVERENKTVVGISRVWDAYALKAENEYKTDILPLCWESLLKYEQEWPEWKLVTFVYMTASVPDRHSIEPLIYLIENSNNPELQDIAGEALAELPETASKMKIEQALEKHGRIEQVLQDALEHIDEKIKQ